MSDELLRLAEAMERIAKALERLTRWPPYLQPVSDEERAWQEHLNKPVED